MNKKYPADWTPAQKAHARYLANREATIARAKRWRADHQDRVDSARRRGQMAALRQRLEQLTAEDLRAAQNAETIAAPAPGDDFEDLL